MGLDVPTFLLGYPEFQDAPPTLIQAKLNEAILMVPQSVWSGGVPTPIGPDTPSTITSPDFNRAPAGNGTSGGGDLTQMATFLYCAHFLALSPYARKMALVDKDGKSTHYSSRLETLKRTVTAGFRLA